MSESIFKRARAKKSANPQLPLGSGDHKVVLVKISELELALPEGAMYSDKTPYYELRFETSDAGGYATMKVWIASYLRYGDMKEMKHSNGKPVYPKLVLNIPSDQEEYDLNKDYGLVPNPENDKELIRVIDRDDFYESTLNKVAKLANLVGEDYGDIIDHINAGNPVAMSIRVRIRGQVRKTTILTGYKGQETDPFED